MTNIKETEESPILQREIKEFLRSNPKIKEALDSFKISEEQYLKAMQSMEPKATTSNKLVIEIEA
jgi:hypothetical protein